MVDVGDSDVEPNRRADLAQEIQQSHRIGSPAHGQQRQAGVWEQPGRLDVLPEPTRKVENHSLETYRYPINLRATADRISPMNETYQLLRTLTSPIAAITTKRGDELNGMIANSAMRASLSDVKARVSVYVHKFNYSHDTIFQTGEFVLHVLDKTQLDTVYALGFTSKRDADKMHAVRHTIGKLGLPVLDGCYGYFECRVVNIMDTGASTLFLGAVEHAGSGGGSEIMTAEYLRDAMPEEKKQAYLAGLEEAQAYSTRMADSMKAVIWRGLGRGVAGGR